ncbi:T9SS C-terminal target domain-containing protein [Tannerella forsythia]|uniref:T9SS C-terminal target domain-containing protein n=1 Tax=Tannerella forsythia TaxID=28112 RepID=A0A3P1YEK1_TANFO|nr:trypsin-like peptidase domain-containing protein [Tannerella forsythia]RRD69574.1 T9SS C-terminal target domain-containing protein [Tannerella forsythia]
MFSDMAYGQVGSSGSCNNNVACFPAWSKESDAVALVLLSNGTEWCSGSLLMTANQSFRPYFLSAFHCIDTDIPKGSLSSSEISNAENWMFKFQYKMSSCSGGYATSGVTYNRATFRAAWNNTDFALMELRNSPAGDPRFSWLGWDRSGNTPTSGTGIHHPSGDVMKISFDNQQLQTSSWGGNNNHWLLSFDNGVVEHGSSGSPLFNQNKRVVGQLHGNQNYNSARPYCEQFRAEYGQFHRSWTGGGTNSTRLSNWLDPNGSGVMTTNTSKYPTLIGPMTICNQPNYTYTIKNLPQGATVQWSSSNNSMTLQSGQGTATALFRQTGFTNAEIRAAVRFNGATIANLAQAITICQPFLSGPSAICNQATYTVENLPPGLQVQWQVHPGLHVYGQTNNSISVSKQSLTSPIEKGWVKATIVGTNITFRNDDILVWKSGTTQTNDLLVGQLDASGGQVEAVYPIQELGRNFQWSASNNWQAMIQGYHFTDFSGTPQSGASSVYITVRFDDPCGSETIIYKEFELPSTYSFSLSPNPVTDVTTLQWKLSGEAISMNSNSQVTQAVVWNRSAYEIQLWSGMTMLRSFRTNEPTFQIPMAGLPAGLYFVRVVKDGQTYTQKLIKK